MSENLHLNIPILILKILQLSLPVYYIANICELSIVSQTPNTLFLFMLQFLRIIGSCFFY